MNLDTRRFLYTDKTELIVGREKNRLADAY